MTKEEMLDEMDENCYLHMTDEDSDYEEVKEEYDKMIRENEEEYSDDSDMFPNGRDYDAEDEDGI